MLSDNDLVDLTAFYKVEKSGPALVFSRVAWMVVESDAW